MAGTAARAQQDESMHSASTDWNTSQSDVNGKAADGAKEVVERLDVAQAEDKAVYYLRLILMLVLIASAVAVSLIVYFYTFGEEEDAFEENFESDATKLLSAIGSNFDKSMGAADAFMFRVVSQAKSTNAEWPMVTIPHLAVQAAKLIGQTNSIYFCFYPHIEKEDRATWENFTRDNHDWVDESLEVQSRNPNFHGPILEDYEISNTIWRNEGHENQTSPGPFMPSWMGSPVIPYYYPYNWNILAYDAFAKGLLFAFRTKSVVVTAVANHADPNDPIAVSQAAITSDWAIPYLDSDEDPNEPFSDMYYPVMDSIDDVIIDTDTAEDALGIVAFSFYWRHSLKNILPSNSKGVILVVENPCGNQTFTYELNGAEPTFLGFEDKHESKFDEYARASTLEELTNNDGTYSGLPMNDEFCPYILTVYPSTKMEERFKSQDPVIFTVVAALIFLFTSALFVLYDTLVARRQSIIKRRALASGAIVSSLFPEQVRNKLYEENEAKVAPARSNNHRSSLMANGVLTSDGGDDKTGGSGRPNAYLYPETTIFFADLAGFTQWSSTKSPEEVFTLLETIYGAIDKIAKRRCVFKVETIGDCYVAVTGIPKAQEEHAVIMVRFAREVLNKVSQLCAGQLADTLGGDTKQLNMRVGLHSGSTTAGVLRGEKGRFQLFGDTVNTASRMESNGVVGRIQVSQSTADALLRHGRAHWLVPREKTISVKGKGEMQTHLVVMDDAKTASSSGDNSTAFSQQSSSVSDAENAAPERAPQSTTADMTVLEV